MTTARETKFSGNYKEVQDYYRDLRSFVFAQTLEAYPDNSLSANSIRLIDAMTADAWAEEEPEKRNYWSWVDAFHYYNKQAKRFDLCISRSGELVGLSYGIPTAHKSKLKIELVEGTPFSLHKGGLKVFNVVSTAAQIYALLLGADEVRVMNPVNDRVRDFYCSLGYAYVKPKKTSLIPYCTIKVEV